MQEDLTENALLAPSPPKIDPEKPAKTANNRQLLARPYLHPIPPQPSPYELMLVGRT